MKKPGFSFLIRPMSEPTYHADVLIAGAGPAGSALAGLLAARGLDVLLVDRARFPRDKTCGDGLTPRAIAALARLGVLPELEAAGYQRVEGARLHPAGGEPWTLNFADHDLGLPPYGLVAPRYELDERLRANAVRQGARFLAGFNAHEPLRAGEAGRVRGLAGEMDGRAATAEAALTVVATGASIGLLRALGALRKMPPGMNAIRGYYGGVKDPTPHFEFFFEPELAPGYAWVFPLADGMANIGLGVPARGNRDKRNLRPLLDAFIARQPRLREARPVGPAKGFPLRTDFPTARPVGKGYLLVGETLGLVNPVTGEGIDLALETAELAARFIAPALNGNPAALRGYSHALRREYRGFFIGARLLGLAATPAAIRVLARQGKKKPRLARLIAGINLGVASPWQAFSPATWWDLLR